MKTANWGPPPPPPRTREPADVRGLDPYVRWAEETGWRGMQAKAGLGATAASKVLVQMVVRGDVVSCAELKDVKKAGLLQIPKIYFEPIFGKGAPADHFTAWVPRDQIKNLHAAGLTAPWELSQPRRDAERVARGSALGKFGPSRNLVDFAAVNVLKDAIANADVKHRPKLRNVIAVIDFGCAFLNQRFVRTEEVDGRQVLETRVARLWDQGGDMLQPNDPRKEGWPWTVPKRMGYGREIHPGRLQSMVQHVHAHPEIDETTAYRGIDYLIDYDDPRRRISYATHGTHVLDVVGGIDDPLTGRADRASEAALVFVQLPSMTAADSSGASLAGHILDGVRYVLDQCTREARIVINISYGSFAGPHDGHALIETALDELLSERPDDFAIVLAAGNARRQRCHARRTASDKRSALLRVALAGGDTTDSFVEAWYEPSQQSGWQLKARVRGPSREWSPPVAVGQHVLQRDTSAGTDVVAMLCHEPRPPNGKGQALVLLALAPTAQPADIPSALADAGIWEIEFVLEHDPTIAAKQNGASPSVVIQAWIERDDPGQNAGAAPHAFVDQDGDDDLNTLSSLATGQHTIIAGGFRRRGGRPADYSSVGPARGYSSPPMMLAVCEDDDVEPSIAAAAVRSSETWRMNGTSVAAPVLARRLYNAMAQRAEQDPPAVIRRAEWGDVLRALAADSDDGCVRHLDDAAP